jgi:hypothetical protein
MIVRHTTLGSCVALVLTACVGARTTTPARDADRDPSPPPTAALTIKRRPGHSTAFAADMRARTAGVDRVIAGAKQIYENETSGRRAHDDLGFIAGDRVLLERLSRRDYAAAEADARLQMINYARRHITRISVIRGGHAVVNSLWNSNGFFVVSPVTQTLSIHGRNLGTLLVSIQDIVGFIKLVHRDTGAQVVVRGTSGQVRSSLPAAAHLNLPASGTVDVDGSEYDVGTFSLTGWAGETMNVWVLVPA